MSIKKLDDGRYEVDCRPEGRDGPRIRKKFRTKSEALYYQNRIMGDGAKGEFEKKVKEIGVPQHTQTEGDGKSEAGPAQ